MALILCIETTTEVCSVAVFNGNELLYEKNFPDGNMHASHLHLLIDDVLKVAEVKLKYIKAIAVSKGPGSYTGLKVGVASAKGLCYALSVPLIAVDTLYSLTFGFNRQNNTQANSILIPMLDARRMEVYTAVFNNSTHLLEQTQAKIIDETSFATYSNNIVYFFGNGALKCKPVLQHVFNNASFNPFLCNAKYLGILAQQAYEKKMFEDLAYFEPFYLKDFVTTTPKKII
ncbi:MAG: tRNA (adenosine(37)-N6)-threonylcarbamoyltransferase complex dimerization subunit type 1 TsaB [Bacteroidia bacterium]